MYNASAVGLRDWKACLKREVCGASLVNRRYQADRRLQHKGARLVSALLYAANVAQPRMVQLPVSVDYDDAVDATGWVADVNTGHWFPHGSLYSGLDRLPGCTRRLRNSYTVVTSGHKERAPLNKCLMNRFGLLVHGNVLVLRHASRQPVRVTNMHSSERQFVDILLEQ